MRKVMFLIIGLVLITGLIGSCPGGGDEPPEDTQILVSAAASLKNALEEIGQVYEEQNKGVRVAYNFGSSGALQQQIENGSPVDLFISAGKKQMDILAEKMLLKNETRINLLGNELVLIIGKDNTSVKHISDLVKVEVLHIGIGSPESVPVGMYAKEALTSMKLWPALEAKLVQAKDARQVLAYVMTGNAEAGFVYRSDAAVSEKVKVVEPVPPETHQPIVYPAAIISSSKFPGEAKKFLEFLQGDEATAVFIKVGFKKSVQEFR